MFKEFPFKIEPKLKHKLDILIDNLKRDDMWILIDGDEGAGKTNAEAYLLYYIHCATGREFSSKQFYYDAGELFEFAQNTKEKLLGWDEAGLGGLSAEWWNKSQINLIKLSLTGRVLHHVFVMCIPRFEKLKNDLRVDRAMMMIHLDRGKRRNRYGDYIYLTRRGIRALNNIWIKKKIKLYKKCSRKYGGHLGHIPYILDKIPEYPNLEHTLNETKKKAIASIGVKKSEKDKLKLIELQNKVALMTKKDAISQRELAKQLEISRPTIVSWIKRAESGHPLRESGKKEKEIINNDTIKETDDELKEKKAQSDV